jgi:hypothetical protein
MFHETERWADAARADSENLNNWPVSFYFFDVSALRFWSAPLQNVEARRIRTSLNRTRSVDLNMIFRGAETDLEQAAVLPGGRPEGWLARFTGH